jgi:riboflavin synthase
MFTGLVEATCRVRELTPRESGTRLVLDREGWSPAGAQLSSGDSLSISGVCLSLVEQDGRSLAFDVVAETLRRTTLGELRAGDRVNVEPSLTLSSFVGGHFVQGHVDGVGLVSALAREAGDRRLTVEPPAALMKYVVSQGSIAIDGVSLTVAAVGVTDFTVALIPTTLERTTLGDAAAGRRVNLETDVLTRTVVSWLERFHSRA